MNLHFWQVPGWCWVCWTDHLEDPLACDLSQNLGTYDTDVVKTDSIKKWLPTIFLFTFSIYVLNFPTTHSIIHRPAPTMRRKGPRGQGKDGASSLWIQLTVCTTWWIHNLSMFPQGELIALLFLFLCIEPGWFVPCLDKTFLPALSEDGQRVAAVWGW